MRLENKLLRGKVDLFTRGLFGSSSEQLDPGQLELMLQGIEWNKPDTSSEPAAAALEADTIKEAKKNKRRKARRELTEEVIESLPSVDVVVVPEEVKANPKAWRYVDDEITKQIDYKPARYVCRRVIRQRFVKRDEPHRPPVVADLPAMQETLSGRRTGRTRCHLNRKVLRSSAALPPGEDRLDAPCIYLSWQTMARWVVWRAAQWLQPIYQKIDSPVCRMNGELSKTPRQTLGSHRFLFTE